MGPNIGFTAILGESSLRLGRLYALGPVAKMWWFGNLQISLWSSQGVFFLIWLTVGRFFLM